MLFLRGIILLIASSIHFFQRLSPARVMPWVSAPGPLSRLLAKVTHSRPQVGLPIQVGLLPVPILFLLRFMDFLYRRRMDTIKNEEYVNISIFLQCIWTGIIIYSVWPRTLSLKEGKYLARSHKIVSGGMRVENQVSLAPNLCFFHYTSCACLGGGLAGDC